MESTLQAYQRNARLKPFITFLLELDFDKIGVVLDEHSDDYKVKEISSPAFSILMATTLAHLSVP